MRFEKKTALVTGASSGMGNLICKCVAAEGGNVVLADVNPKTLEQAVAEINAAHPGKAAGVVCDVRDYEQVCRARDEAVRTFGGIDILVTMAGGAETRMCGVPGLEFPDVPIEVYDWGLDVNLKGQFYFAHAVAAQMRKQQRGVIILVGLITFFLRMGSEEDGAYRDGTYYGEMETGGEVTEIAVEIKNGEIVDVSMEEPVEAVAVFYPLLETTAEEVGQAVVESQSLTVEVAPENAHSAQLVLDAVAECLKKAER